MVKLCVFIFIHTCRYTCINMIKSYDADSYAVISGEEGGGQIAKRLFFILLNFILYCIYFYT